MTSNYSNITKQNGTLTVNKVSVTVTADSKTKVYGEDNPELTYTESDFVNEETLESLGIVPELSTTAMKDQYSRRLPDHVCRTDDINNELRDHICTWNTDNNSQ